MQTLNFLRHPTRYKYRTYLFLNRPQSVLEISYQITLALLVLVCIVFTMYAHQEHENLLFGLDLLVALIFGVEFLVQVWSSTSLPKYRYRHWIHVIVNPICLLDLFILIATITGTVFGLRENLISVGLRGFRMLQFFEHRYHLWRLVGSVIWTGRFQLAVCLYFAMLLMISVSFLIYFIENPTNSEFASLGQSMWFTLVSFTTVGFGDVVPASVPGKIVTALSLIIGTSIFSLPAGIIGAGLALKVEKEEKIRGTVRENYAARLIQNAWHVYWVGQVFAQRQANTPNPSPSPSTAILLQPQFYKKYNPTAIQFLYLLKFHVLKKRFQRSLNLLSSNNFHELYTANYLEQNEKIRNLQLDVRNMQIMLTDIHRIMLKAHYPSEERKQYNNNNNSNNAKNRRASRVITQQTLISPAKQWRARYRRYSTTDLFTKLS